jgi:hypothetical protein
MIERCGMGRGLRPALMTVRHALTQTVIARDAVEKRWDRMNAELASFTQAAHAEIRQR